jgi:hypothetical protein
MTNIQIYSNLRILHIHIWICFQIFIFEYYIRIIRIKIRIWIFFWLHCLSFRSTFLNMMLIIDIKICFRRSTISFCLEIFDTIDFHLISCSNRWLSNSSLKYFFSQSMRRRRTQLFSCSLCCWKCLKASNMSNLTRST